MNAGSTSHSKQLIGAALRGEPGTRVPVGPLAVHYCAGVAGFTIREYTTNPKVLAESVVRYYESFKPDAVWLSADTWVSAEAMGVTVGAEDDHQPFAGLGPPLVQSAADIDHLPPPDIGCKGRYPLMIEALSRIVAALGRDAWVVACFDQYPFSLAAALMGVNQIMLKVKDDPPFVTALMERCLEHGIAYGRALAKTGADMLSGGDSTAGLLGPELYRAMAFPFERRLVAASKSATGLPVSLHICGNATPLLKDMAATGADVLEIDHRVDMPEACDIVGREVALWGNLDPVSVLAQGTPLQVEAAARAALAAVQAAGHSRFVLSSGCTLAVETPAENLRALIKAVL